MEMVWLLLNFIHGDGDANWLLHLETFSAMLPYDRAFDHLNYYRWTVHQEFTENRAHAVSTSSSESSFNSVSPDMALEQTVNRDSKPKDELLKVLAWRAQEIGGHSQLIRWQLQQRLSKLLGGLQQAQASIENWSHKELKEMKMT